MFTLRKKVQKLKRSRHTYEKAQLEHKAPATQERAKYVLDNFDRFSQKYYQKSIDQLVDEIDSEEIAFDILQAWINSLKGMSARTIINYFSSVRKFLHYRGIKFLDMDIQQNLVFPKIHDTERYGVTKDDIKALLEMVKYKKRALYLCQLSSGLRIGELVRLRKKHLDLTKKRIMVKLPAEFDKLGRDRITFFSKEAEKKLRPIIKNLNDEDLIFGTNEIWEKAKKAEMAYLSKYVDRINNERYSNGIRKITTHSFRAYFITKVSRIDPNLAKRFTGQRGYLLQYDRLSIDERLEKYIEFEPELLIYESQESKTITNLRDEYQTKLDTLKDELKDTLKSFALLYSNQGKEPLTLEDMEKIKKNPAFREFFSVIE